MNKKPIYKVESVELPDILKNALISVDEQVPYVSYKDIGARFGLKEKMGPAELPLAFLEKNNHSFYIGKILRTGVAKRVKAALGWQKIQQGIYDKDFVRASLKELIKKTKNFSSARMVVCNVFSEMFNGREDAVLALTTGEQIKFIQEILKKEFPNTPQSSVEIVDLEKLPEHTDLFMALRQSQNLETGLVNLEKAWGGNDCTNISENPSSLELARYLYSACKNNENFEHIIKSTIPGRLREGDEQQIRMRMGYGIAEIAIRLSDIFAGRTIQGGVERQAVYDDIIEKILKGANGPYKNYPELRQLLDLFSDKKFVTMHLDGKNNPFKLRSIKSAAIRKITTSTMMAVGISMGFVEMGKALQRREDSQVQEDIERDLADKLKSVKFYYYGDSWMRRVEKVSLDSFKKLHMQILENIKVRYVLPIKIINELSPILMNYLITIKEELPDIERNLFYQDAMTDQFIQDHLYWLKTKGFEVGRPYQFLEKYEKEFNLFLKGKEVKFESEFHYCDDLSGVVGNSTGTYRDFDLWMKNGVDWGSPRKLKICVEDFQDFSRIVGVREITYDEEVGVFENGRKKFDTNLVAIFVEEYFRARENFKLLPIWKYRKELLASRYAFSRLLDFTIGIYEKDELLFTKKIGKVSWKGMETELIVYNYHNKEDNVSYPLILAKNEGDEVYSLRLTRELAEFYLYLSSR